MWYSRKLLCMMYDGAQCTGIPVYILLLLIGEVGLISLQRSKILIVSYQHYR